MLFNSPQFFVFFALVCGLYFNLRHRGQNLLLLVASYIFYGWWDWRFTGLMLFSTVVNYACALRIKASPTPRGRKRWLMATLITELSVLGFFKYYNFFVSTAEALAGSMGLPAHYLHLGLVLPVGLSFYTFKTMSYVIDVYRGSFDPTPRFLDFALFVSFFPQLVAGPIERASQLMPEVVGPRPPLTADAVRTSGRLIGWGLFKKVIVADGCAHLVSPVFSNPSAFGGLDYLVAIYAFAFQIYGDFSGYSDMAVGLAGLLGFRLMTNFHLPYFSTNPSEFWHRWHISLSTWLRDYLYIPLGGSRANDGRTYRNLIVTMTLGGLWHGAKWTMVLWGLYHGLVLSAHRFWTRRHGVVATRGGVTGGRALLQMVVMFQVVCLGWLLFRADSAAQAQHILIGIGTDPRLTAWGRSALVTLVQLTFVLLAYEISQHLAGGESWVTVRRSPLREFAFGLAVVYSATFYWMLHRSLVSAGRPFIYFQF